MKSDLVKLFLPIRCARIGVCGTKSVRPLDENLFYADTGYSWGSLQRECAHVIDAMHGYMQRLHGSKQVTRAFATNDPDRSLVRERWDAVESEWKSYMARFDDREFDRMVDTVYRDKPITVPAWQLVFQVFNHNTLHRAEMLQIVAAVKEPVDIDLSFASFCHRQTGR